MQYIVDFHIHSKYSRAVSKLMDLEHINETAKRKGIQIIATSDFTHPAWFLDMQKKLVSQGNGLYKLKNSRTGTNFILSTELSCIYKKNDKCRRIHIVVLAPSLKAVEKLNKKLDPKFNLKSDGRPILGIDVKELTKIILDIDEKFMVIPAHIWTPWFALFGSKSGFDSIEECFEELSKHIFAYETGLSSDPPMNWRVKNLDRLTLISNSDAHSLDNLGREANVFEFDKLSYDEIYQTLKNKDKKKLLYTIEFFPQEGKYHFDGHRACNINFSPKETRKHKNICPKCGRALTVGVLNRVEELADREEGKRPKNAIDFKSLVPLKEIISQILGVGVKSKAVAREYENLIKNENSDFDILLNLSKKELNEITLPEISEAIINVRKGNVRIEPGYDGEYGKVEVLFEKNKKIQEKLF